MILRCAATGVHRECAYCGMEIFKTTDLDYCGRPGKCRTLRLAQRCARDANVRARKTAWQRTFRARHPEYIARVNARRRLTRKTLRIKQCQGQNQGDMLRIKCV